MANRMLSPINQVVNLLRPVADTPVQSTQTSKLAQQLFVGRNTSPSVFNFDFHTAPPLSTAATVSTAAPRETQVGGAAQSIFGSHLQEPEKVLTLQHPIDSKKLEPVRNRVIEAIKNKDTAQLEKLGNDFPVVQKSIRAYLDEFDGLQSLMREQEYTDDEKKGFLMDVKETLSKRAPTLDVTVRNLAVDQALSSASKRQRTE